MRVEYPTLVKEARKVVAKVMDSANIAPITTERADGNSVFLNYSQKKVFKVGFSVSCVRGPRGESIPYFEPTEIVGELGNEFAPAGGWHKWAEKNLPHDTSVGFLTNGFWFKIEGRRPCAKALA